MLFCNKEDCKYRSKRKSNFISNGKFLYKCTAKHTLIDIFSDGGSDMYKPTANSCMCLTYREEEDDLI